MACLYRKISLRLILCKNVDSLSHLSVWKTLNKILGEVCRWSDPDKHTDLTAVSLHTASVINTTTEPSSAQQTENEY